MLESLLSINSMLVILIGVFVTIIAANLIAAVMNLALGLIVRIKGW